MKLSIQTARWPDTDTKCGGDDDDDYDVGESGIKESPSETITIARLLFGGRYEHFSGRCNTENVKSLSMWQEWMINENYNVRFEELGC